MKFKTLIKPLVSLILSIIVLNSGYFITDTEYRLIFNIFLIVVAVGVLVISFLENKQKVKKKWEELTPQKKKFIIMAISIGFVTCLIFLILQTS